MTAVSAEAEQRTPGRLAARESSFAIRMLSTWLGRLVGLLLGLAAGAYGAIAGLTLGFMVDEARAEARRRRRIRAYLADPDGPELEEPLPGIAAAAVMALAGRWPEPQAKTSTSARDCFEALCDSLLALDRSQWRWLRALLEAAPSAPAATIDAQARRLAMRGCPATRRLLGDFAYARLAASQTRFDREAEQALRATLADCGLDAAAVAQSRSTALSETPDPWKLLEIEPGASALEVRRAYRRLSRRYHPDAAGGGVDAEAAAARFRELRGAYEELLALDSDERTAETNRA